MEADELHLVIFCLVIHSPPVLLKQLDTEASLVEAPHALCVPFEGGQEDGVFLNLVRGFITHGIFFAPAEDFLQGFGVIIQGSYQD